MDDSYGAGGQMQQMQMQQMQMQQQQVPSPKHDLIHAEKSASLSG